MVARVIEVELFDLVVFGASGDLAHRKLIPALYHRAHDGQVPEDARIICSSRRAYTDNEYRQWAKDALNEHVSDLDEDQLSKFLARLRYVQIDVGSGEGFDALKELLDDRPDVIRAFYLAVAPDLFGTICEHLGKADLVNAQSRVVIEKPIGKDGASARTLNATIGKVFAEDQIFRIDHYLGKETVQNLMALRFANALFEPLWNAAHIDHVQITVAESLGVGGRAGYYDTAGALRDMVQNHLLQLLCLVAMEPPESMNADSVRDEKLKVLKALAPITENTADKLTVRGQYTAGASAGGAVPGYLEELGHDGSSTETFVALKAEIANWRWAGVPFYLRTGKRLAKRVSEIVVQFRPIPHSIFSEEAGSITANRLIIRLQPDEGVQMQIMIKDPGPGGMRLRKVPLDMSFADAFKIRNPDAYERLIMDVIRGNQTLFMRRDEVDAAWAWIDPILAAWNASKDMPRNYTAGTWGPSASIALIERDGRTWAEEGF
ncbi:glucose-6-phosphate dehydrogenase [Roseibium sp. RKSG952]|uniref:glucose-6-phosphate dehydrogenase n=1 Tax=Roseibium sp. RKSG952 TaxID=2529384 RepID=UPI0012BB5578|nr:glucose-6-phosphate dehydrogenase [Roseibium sp. RKSG952]MTH96231.1 glucose-6-phosphate dehydrogenase [Roseibium sp. RKSG952]